MINKILGLELFNMGNIRIYRSEKAAGNLPRLKIFLNAGVAALFMIAGM